MRNEVLNFVKRPDHAAASLIVTAALILGSSGHKDNTQQITDPVLNPIYTLQLPETQEYFTAHGHYSLDNSVTTKEIEKGPIELSLQEPLAPPQIVQDQTKRLTPEAKINPEQKQVTLPASTEGQDDVVKASRLDVPEGFDPNLRLPKQAYNEYWALYVYNYFIEAGLPNLAMEGVLISQCESGLNPNETHVNEDGSVDTGLLMINDVHKMGNGAFNPDANLAKGVELVKLQNGFEKAWVYCSKKVNSFLYQINSTVSVPYNDKN